MNRTWFMALFLLVVTALPAQAHSVTATYSDWDVVAGNMVRLTILFPNNQAQQLAPANTQPTPDIVREYVLKHVAVDSASGSCPPVDQGYDIGYIDTLSSIPGFYRFEVFFQCNELTGLTLTNRVLFDHSDQHIDFAQIHTAGISALRLFTVDYQRHSLPAAGPVASDPITDYARMGVFHILLSPVRIALIIALLFLAGNWGGYFRIIAAMAVGYGLSLAISLTGMVLPEAGMSEGLIGFALLLLVADILGRSSGKMGITTGIVAAVYALLAIIALIMKQNTAAIILLGAGLASLSYLTIRNWRANAGFVVLLPVGLFGLLDGFNLFTDLAVMKLPTLTLASLLAAFDLGTLSANAVLLAVALAGSFLFRLRYPKLEMGMVTDFAVTVLCGIGAFWLIANIYA